MSKVIKIENLSKEYRLGEVGTGTISRDINAWAAKIRGKENPNLKIDDIKKNQDSGYHKALSNISFEINEGDVLGIIGKNGAGKSTLLKILSRVTTPTSGQFKVKGRIASLLEVGTGFHPDLTGRDNVFLNGAILGMRKSEIKNKFDEIVDFSGVEKFIDTPVKRYSSGMYVRLAFAVAAHLEPEILIVDEVLAVGDVAFQNKCMGKMSEVSKQGRTILFVSHNMQAMSKLCTRGILLKEGNLIADCSISGAVKQYLEENTSSDSLYLIQAPEGKDEINGHIEKIQIEDLKGNLINEIPVGMPWQVRVSFLINKPTEHFIVGINITDATDVNVNTTWTKPCLILEGRYDAIFKQETVILNPQRYNITIALSSYERSIHFVSNIASLYISDVVHEKSEIFLRTQGVGIVLNQMDTIILKK